jgi:tyrosyl-tRNA synthetase
MVLQAYDFVELNRRYGCVLQMGGSDQWGNIVNGIDLGRCLAGAQFVRADLAALHHRVRAKMGKTAAGTVWLNADMVSPYDIMDAQAPGIRQAFPPACESLHPGC